MATKEFSQDLMCYFYLAARALPKRIGVSGTDTVRGGAARWRPRLTVQSPARWLSMTFGESDHVPHACPDAEATTYSYM